MEQTDQWAIWSFYNVILPAVLPLALVWSGLRLVGKPKALLEIIGDGQLCFFSIALVAVTINDIAHMAPDKRQTPWAKSHLQWAEPSSYLIVIMVVFVFGLIVGENAGNADSDKRRLT